MEMLDNANAEIRGLSPGIDHLDEFSLNDPQAVLAHHLCGRGGLAMLREVVFLRLREISPEASAEVDEILETASAEIGPLRAHALLLEEKAFFEAVFVDPARYGVPPEMRGSSEICEAWIWANLETLPHDNVALSVARKVKAIALRAWHDVFVRLRGDQKSGMLQ